MKALIRRTGETITEADDIACISWKDGKPLTDPDWPNGPYKLIENYSSLVIEPEISGDSTD